MPSERAFERYAYLDASAIVKLVVIEPETAALEADLAQRAGLVTSRLGVTEVRRAARRAGGRRLVQQVEDVLEALVILEMTPGMFDRAAELVPATLRTLDALHLSAALELNLPSVDFITYDRRLADAARRAGLGVTVPRRPDNA
jgi:predicted nucleic acid-binding protein